MDISNKRKAISLFHYLLTQLLTAPETVGGIISSHGAGYRLRFLYKSHLSISSTWAAKHDSTPYFACHFCIRVGFTVREGDATVFRSPGDLMRHIASHPQPLPPISDITVCYGEMRKTELPDFDLHLPSPQSNLMPEHVPRSGNAIAKQDHYQRVGHKLSKPSKYDGEILQFMEGSRITGVTFPEIWDGKWCLGWHDGAFGAFSAKAVEIRPPRESELPSGGRSRSGINATAKWKWHPNDTGEIYWLDLDKGEIISNVNGTPQLSDISTDWNLPN